MASSWLVRVPKRAGPHPRLAQGARDEDGRELPSSANRRTMSPASACSLRSFSRKPVRSTAFCPNAPSRCGAGGGRNPLFGAELSRIAIARSRTLRGWRSLQPGGPRSVPCQSRRKCRDFAGPSRGLDGSGSIGSRTILAGQTRVLQSTAITDESF
jgi:hypothetical protein